MPKGNFDQFRFADGRIKSDRNYVGSNILNDKQINQSINQASQSAIEPIYCFDRSINHSFHKSINPTVDWVSRSVNQSLTLCDRCHVSGRSIGWSVDRLVSHDQLINKK